MIQPKCFGSMEYYVYSAMCKKCKYFIECGKVENKSYRVISTATKCNRTKGIQRHEKEKQIKRMREE